MEGIKGLKIGVCFTGSFCTFTKMLAVTEELVAGGAEVYPIFSSNVTNMDNRFFKATEFISKVQEITGKQGIFTIQEAEPIGPRKELDVMVIAPCT